MQLADVRGRRIAVVAGGVSNERTVSLSSGSQVCAALTQAGIANELIDTRDAAAAFARLATGGFDVVFIALHGKGGEDGTIQGACELLGLPYTGSGVLASALAIDKARAKALYHEYGILTAPSVTLRRGRPYDVQDIMGVVGERCVVKPVADGSSLGMSLVHGPSELPQALDVAFATGGDVLVETFVEGMEVTVSVIGNDDPQALPVIEIIPSDEFYSYQVKYIPGGSEHVIPARLEPDVYARVQRDAVTAHQALGCRGMSRSDFIVHPELGPVILETNTIPGMTPTSLLPDAARHAGYDFPTLCALLVAYALEPRP